MCSDKRLKTPVLQPPPPKKKPTYDLHGPNNSYVLKPMTEKQIITVGDF